MDYQRSITFEQFVEYLTQTPDHDLVRLFKSQTSYLAQKLCDCIAALEQIERLLSKLESRFNQRLDLEWENRIAGRRLILGKRRLAGKLPEQLRQLRGRPHPSELLRSDLVVKLEKRIETDLRLWRIAKQGSG